MATQTAQEIAEKLANTLETLTNQYNEGLTCPYELIAEAVLYAGIALEELGQATCANKNNPLYGGCQANTHCSAKS